MLLFTLLQAETLLLQAPQGGGMTSLLMPLLLFAVLFVFMILPQRKVQKQQKLFLSSLSKGDEVVSTSGILGKITKIEGDIITLEVGSKVYIRFARNAISKQMTDELLGSNAKQTAKVADSSTEDSE